MINKEENILDYGMPSPEKISQYALDMYAFLRMGDSILRQIKKKNNAKTIRALVEYHNALAALFKAITYEKFKPCPFCGSKRIFIDVRDSYDGVITWKNKSFNCYVKCSECGALSGFHNTEEDATNAWNRRAYDQEAKS